LGSCHEIGPANLLKKELRGLGSFTNKDSVALVVCKSCQRIYEADQRIAENLVFAAKKFKELEEEMSGEDFNYLLDGGDFSEYSLELSNCRKCSPDNPVGWVWLKKNS